MQLCKVAHLMKSSRVCGFVSCCSRTVLKHLVTWSNHSQPSSIRNFPLGLRSAISAVLSLIRWKSSMVRSILAAQGFSEAIPGTPGVQYPLLPSQRQLCRLRRGCYGKQVQDGVGGSACAPLGFPCLGAALMVHPLTRKPALGYIISRFSCEKLS